jgi:hypothetical protein
MYASEPLFAFQLGATLVATQVCDLQRKKRRVSPSAMCFLYFFSPGTQPRNAGWPGSSDSQSSFATAIGNSSCLAKIKKH